MLWICTWNMSPASGRRGRHVPKSRTTVGRWSPEHWHSHPCWVCTNRSNPDPHLLSINAELSEKPKSLASGRKGEVRAGLTYRLIKPQGGPGGCDSGAGGCGKGWVVSQVLMEAAELGGRNHWMSRAPSGE